MRHPTEGVLRRLIDEPAGVAGSDREHIAGCSSCLASLAQIREDADAVEAALRTDDTSDVDVSAAWHRLSTAPAATAAAPTAPARTSRFRDLARRPAIAALAFGLVLTGAGTAAANGWFEIFRTESVAPISLGPADILALPDLDDYGRFRLSDEPVLQRVADAESAAKATGLTAPVVAELPRGVAGEPTYQIGGKVTATFTFSAERAQRAAAAAGETLPTPPPGMDGSSVRLTAGPGMAGIWSSQASGAPALIVGRTFAPTASSTGLPFETIRDYLLQMPGLPDNVAAQLRTFTADGSTLPIPVPAEEVTTKSIEVSGVPATVVSTRDETMSIVMWVKDGVLTAVAGSLDEDEVVSVARELR